jgi:putative methionine-R-sulfoxide reductase with GAF domain
MIIRNDLKRSTTLYGSEAHLRKSGRSLETKSEIVVPIFVGGKVVGELDIDSHSASAFQEEDLRSRPVILSKWNRNNRTTMGVHL